MAGSLDRFETFDELMREVVGEVMCHPDHDCAPRGQRVKEVIARTYTLEDPRARLLGAPARKADYGFAVGEFLWYWTGKNDLRTMLYYNKRMAQYSDDGETLNSAYGRRMGVAFPDLGSQWVVCKKTLVDDPDSRRAVLLINRPEDQKTACVSGSKDVPCTLALQFFVRGGKLELHVTMRSNDAIWGLAYDLFSFTLFQECMLLELQREEKFRGLRLGPYHHTAGSLHVYERHFGLAERMIVEYGSMLEDGRRCWPSSTPMEPIPSLELLENLSEKEELLRLGKIDAIDSRDPELGSERFASCLGWMAEQLNEHRKKRDREKSLSRCACGRQKIADAGRCGECCERDGAYER